MYITIVHVTECVCCYCVRMDVVNDDSCVMKYIEIVPLDNFDSTDDKFDPLHVKVCVYFILCVIHVYS